MNLNGNGPNDPPGTGDTPPVEQPDNTPDVEQPDAQPAAGDEDEVQNND